MNVDASTARVQQQAEELCAATIRALRDDPDLHFRGRLLHRGRRRLPLRAPHLHPSPEEDDFVSFRGAADGMALRLALSDPGLHHERCPAEPVDRLIFEMLEQFRVESLVPPHLPGVVANLRHRHEQWSLAFHHSGLTESARGILIYTVAQICRSRVTREPVVEETEDLLETTRGSIVPLIGHDLRGLRTCREDQQAYAEHALGIARAVGDMVRTADAEEPDDGSGDDPADRARFALFVDIDDDSDDYLPTAPSGRSTVLTDAEDGYRAFTTAYDRERPASALVRAAQLREYRERLDRRVAGLGINVARLARELKALLADPARDGWDAGQEQGLIDGRRLAQLVVSPTERRLFRTERIEPVADCLVTFLVDCSGSMKEHAEAVAVLVDVFGRALELAGVSSEVLGFTTGSWNGGRAVRDWRRAGRPAHPGRLNELSHIVFKSADSSWRAARPQIAALLKADLFREGVDGEAVEWACRRIDGRPEARRLLVVLSDGSPMDSATNLVNDAHFLDHHLRDVVLGRELSGALEIYGLGVGLDLSPYYSRCHALDLSQGMTNEAFREVVGLLAGRGQR